MWDNSTPLNLLAIDYGSKRVGLAYADTALGVAVPIPAAVENSAEGRLEHVAREIKARKIDMLVVGYPLNMDGSAGDKAREVDEYISLVEQKFSLPVARADERLSSFQAESDMRFLSSKKSKSVYARKKYRKSGDIDSRAAAIFLQEYLDMRRIGGEEPL